MVKWSGHEMHGQRRQGAELQRPPTWAVGAGMAALPRHRCQPVRLPLSSITRTSIHMSEICCALCFSKCSRFTTSQRRLGLGALMPPPMPNPPRPAALAAPRCCCHSCHTLCAAGRAAPAAPRVAMTLLLLLLQLQQQGEMGVWGGGGNWWAAAAAISCDQQGMFSLANAPSYLTRLR